MTPIISEVCIPGRVAKAVAAMCSTDCARPILQHAVIRAGHLIATNGHVLTRVPLFEDPASEPGTSTAPAYAAHKDWTISVEALKDIKVSEHLSVNLETGRLLKLKSADASMVATLPDLQGAGSYPNIEQVIPNGGAVARLILDPDYMIRVANLAKAFGWGSIVLDMADGVVSNPKDAARRPVILRAPHHGSETIGLLMPKTII